MKNTNLTVEKAIKFHLNQKIKTNIINKKTYQHYVL